jgi:hypothetical protein
MIMKILLIPVLFIFFAWAFSSCKSSSGPATYCDTCLKEPLKFVGDNPSKPYVAIGVKDCRPDTVTWSGEEFGSSLRSSIEDLVGIPVAISKDHIKCVIKDTLYAWLVFSDCFSGRGIQAKLPFSKTNNLVVRKSGINNYDPKYSIADGLIAYSDGGNIFVEELTTGKKATMTFGKDLEIDFDAIHEKLDSVNITPAHVWAKVKIDNEWKELQKNIELK